MSTSSSASMLSMYSSIVTVASASSSKSPDAIFAIDHSFTISHLKTTQREMKLDVSRGYWKDSTRESLIFFLKILKTLDSSQNHRLITNSVLEDRNQGYFIFAILIRFDRRVRARELEREGESKLRCEAEHKEGFWARTKDLAELKGCYINPGTLSSFSRQLSTFPFSLPPFFFVFHYC